MAGLSPACALFESREAQTFGASAKLIGIFIRSSIRDCDSRARFTRIPRSLSNPISPRLELGAWVLGGTAQSAQRRWQAIQHLGVVVLLLAATLVPAFPSPEARGAALSP